MSENPDAATPKSIGPRLPDPSRLPEQLRRKRGVPVAAQQPGFWPFGPPPKGKGPKPIRQISPQSGKAAPSSGS